jgi:hypothetical protein
MERNTHEEAQQVPQNIDGAWPAKSALDWIWLRRPFSLGMAMRGKLS